MAKVELTEQERKKLDREVLVAVMELLSCLTAIGIPTLRKTCDRPTLRRMNQLYSLLDKVMALRARGSTNVPPYP